MITTDCLKLINTYDASIHRITFGGIVVKRDYHVIARYVTN